MQMADKIIMRPVEALIPYARNVRTHSDEQVAQNRRQHPGVPLHLAVAGDDAVLAVDQDRDGETKLPGAALAACKLGT